MNPLSASVPLFVIPSLPEVYTSSKKHSFKVIENSPITQITALFFYRKTVPQLLTPSLSGSFPVGHTSFVVKGPKNLIGIDIYSPTQKVKGAELLEYTLYPGHPFSPIAKRFTTQSFENLCPIEDKKFPVILLSHGFGFEPGDYRPLCEELSSHGFVVLALCHPFSAAYSSFDHTTEIDELPGHKVAAKQAKDIAYILSSGLSQKGTAFKALSQIADFNKAYLLGHGLGGTASLLAAGKTSIKGCINIDGFWEEESFTHPLLTLISKQKQIPSLPLEEEKDTLFARERLEKIHHNAPSSKLHFLREAGYDDFLIQPFLEQALGKKTRSPLLHEVLKPILDFLE